MLFRINFIAIIILFIISCSNSPKDKSVINDNEINSPENQYIEAMVKFDNQQFAEAITIFKNIEKIYPLSNEAIQSQIMSGFIDYIRLDYDSAILKFRLITKKYPSLKNIDYVYYMKALCYYEQISHEGLDGEYNNLALKNLNQVINRFPNSEYAKDSQQKIILLKENLAAKDMEIALFYLKQNKYLAAINRYSIVIEKYNQTKFTPEALYRIIEIYFSLGMIEDAEKTNSVLLYNYPDSKWGKLSQKLLNPQINKNKKTIIKKLSNLLSINNEND